MDTTDHLLVLAHAIDVYARTLADLEDVMDLDETLVSYGLLGDVRRKLRNMSMTWWTNTHNEPVWRDENTARAVSEARVWVDAHGVRLAELREQETTA